MSIFWPVTPTISASVVAGATPHTVELTLGPIIAGRVGYVRKVTSNYAGQARIYFVNDASHAYPAAFAVNDYAMFLNRVVQVTDISDQPASITVQYQTPAQGGGTHIQSFDYAGTGTLPTFEHFPWAQAVLIEVQKDGGAWTRLFHAALTATVKHQYLLPGDYKYRATLGTPYLPDYYVTLANLANTRYLISDTVESNTVTISQPTNSPYTAIADLTVSLDGDTAVLDWTHPSNVPAIRYTIEKSYDQVNWSVVVSDVNVRPPYVDTTLNTNLTTHYRVRYLSYTPIINNLYYPYGIGITGHPPYTEDPLDINDDGIVDINDPRHIISLALGHTLTLSEYDYFSSESNISKVSQCALLGPKTAYDPAWFNCTPNPSGLDLGCVLGTQLNYLQRFPVDHISSRADWSNTASLAAAEFFQHVVWSVDNELWLMQPNMLARQPIVIDSWPIVSLDIYEDDAQIFYLAQSPTEHFLRQTDRRGYNVNAGNFAQLADSAGVGYALNVIPGPGVVWVSADKFYKAESSSLWSVSTLYTHTTSVLAARFNRTDELIYFVDNDLKLWSLTLAGSETEIADLASSLDSCADICIDYTAEKLIITDPTAQSVFKCDWDGTNIVEWLTDVTSVIGIDCSADRNEFWSAEAAAGEFVIVNRELDSGSVTATRGATGSPLACRFHYAGASRPAAPTLTVTRLGNDNVLSWTSGVVAHRSFEVFASLDAWETETLIACVSGNTYTDSDASEITAYRVRSTSYELNASSSTWTNPLHALDVLDDGWVNGLDYMTLLSWLSVVAAGDTPDPLGPPFAHNGSDPYLDTNGSNTVTEDDLTDLLVYLADIESEFSASVAYSETTTQETSTDSFTCPDIAWWGPGGSFSNSDLWLGIDDEAPGNGDYEHASLRFTVDIPAGASITNAELQFTAETSTSGQNIYLTIAAEASADAGTINDFASVEASAASLLVSTEAWEELPNWLQGGQYSSPDISAIIQEYIDQPGYTGVDAHLVVHVLNNNTDPEPATRRIRLLDPCVGSQNPRLVVSYTLPTTTPEPTTPEPTTQEPTTEPPVEADCHHVISPTSTGVYQINMADSSDYQMLSPTYGTGAEKYITDAEFDVDTQIIYFSMAPSLSGGNPSAGGDIIKRDLSGGPLEVIYSASGLNKGIYSLWWDRTNSHLYFLKDTDYADNYSEVLRCDLDGSNVTEIVAKTAIERNCKFMYVDFANGHIYVPTKVSGVETISRFDLDGTNRDDTITGLTQTVLCPVLDLTNSYIYFSTSNYPSHIYRIDLDGTNLTQIYNNLVFRTTPHGLALDEEAQILYISIENTSNIYSADVSGGAITTQTLFFDRVSTLGAAVSNAIKLCGTFGDAPTTSPDPPTTAEPTTTPGPEGGYYLSWIDNTPLTIPNSEPAATGPRIRRTNRDAAWIDTALHDEFNAVALIASAKFGRYYWSDPLLGAVYSVKFDGTDIQVELTGLTQPCGLALDETNDRLYVVEHTLGQLVRADLGVDSFTAIVSGLTNPLDVVLDVTANRAYLTAGRRIVRTTLAGGPVTTVTQFSDAETLLYGLDIDLVDDRLFFTKTQDSTPSVAPGEIYSVKPDGTELVRIVDNINLPLKCVVDPDAGHIFWVEPLQNVIRRANLDGTDIVQFVREVGSFYSWLALLPVPDVTTTEEPTTEEPPPTSEEPTTEEPTTEEPTTTPEPTTRAPDVIGEREQICVDQPQGGSRYPFVWPSDNLDLLIGDLYLAYNNANYEPPFKLTQLLNFNQDSTSRYELVICDNNDAVIFDTRDSIPAQFKQYAWADTKRILEYVDAAEQILRVVVYTVSDTPISWDSTITPTDGRIDPRALYAIPAHISKLAVRTTDGLVEIPNGVNVVFSAGYNLTLAETTVSTAGSFRGADITLAAIPGEGLGRYPGCDESVDILTINMVTPDSSGNINLKFDGPGLSESHCYRLERPVAAIAAVDNGFDELSLEPNTIKLINNCEPCCSCDDFVRVYQAIRRLYNKYKRLGARAEAVRDQLRKNADRWRANAECRRTTSLRGILMPLADCRAGAGAGICNNTADSLKNITVKIDFSGSIVSGCVRCSSVFRKGNVDPVNKVPAGRFWPYKLRGTWPTFYADFDCIDSGTMGSVVFQL